MRVAPTGATILKGPGGTTTMGGKQIITVHKTGNSGSSQSQIVTLVKTTQGMAMASVRNINGFNNLYECQTELLTSRVQFLSHCNFSCK